MKLMILDGNSIVNRAFYGIRMLNAPDGTPTNAVYGFLTIFQRILELEQPQAVCVAFDVHAPTFRHEQYALYKAQRKPMPEELVVQMPLLKQTLDHMGIRRLELAGWEADDLLGTVAKRCEAAGWACEIVTGDKDSLQLITDTTHVCHVKTRMGQTETIEYTPEVFRAEYGFDPIHMIDLKALMGDSSDNIPGVPGIGEKTAKDLLVRFGTVADIYRDLDTLDIKPGVRKKLTEGCESAQLSFDLATIRTDAPIDFAPESAIWDRDYRPELYDWFRRLGFLKLSEKWGLQPADSAAAPEKSRTRCCTLRGAVPRWRGRWRSRSAGRTLLFCARRAFPRRPCVSFPLCIPAPVSQFSILPGKMPEKRSPARHCRYLNARRSSARRGSACSRARSLKRRSPRLSRQGRRAARFRRRRRGCAPCSESAVTVPAAACRSWKRKWRR